MEVPTTSPLKNALVRRVRSSSALRTGLKGGIHQRLAPRRVRYPFMTYSEVSAPVSYSTGKTGSGITTEIHALYDLTITGLKTVEAENLAKLLYELFSSSTSAEELQALMEGQQITLCHRVANTPTGPELDDEGRRVVRVGATFEIWMVWPSPIPVPSP